MTEKELMYIEDALSHMEQFNNMGCAFAEMTENVDTTDMIDNVLDENKKIFKKIYNLLGE